MALEDSKDSIMKSPIVIKTSRILNWIFVGVDIDSIRIIVARWSKGSFCTEGQQVVICIGAALHLTNSTLIIVQISGEGASCGRV